MGFWGGRQGLQKAGKSGDGQGLNRGGIGEANPKCRDP